MSNQTITEKIHSLTKIPAQIMQEIIDYLQINYVTKEQHIEFIKKIEGVSASGQYPDHCLHRCHRRLLLPQCTRKCFLLRICSTLLYYADTIQ